MGVGGPKHSVPPPGTRGFGGGKARSREGKQGRPPKNEKPERKGDHAAEWAGGARRDWRGCSPAWLQPGEDAGAQSPARVVGKPPGGLPHAGPCAMSYAAGSLALEPRGDPEGVMEGTDIIRFSFPWEDDSGCWRRKECDRKTGVRDTEKGGCCSVRVRDGARGVHGDSGTWAGLRSQWRWTGGAGG